MQEAVFDAQRGHSQQVSHTRKSSRLNKGFGLLFVEDHMSLGLIAMSFNPFVLLISSLFGTHRPAAAHRYYSTFKIQKPLFSFKIK